MVQQTNTVSENENRVCVRRLRYPGLWEQPAINGEALFTDLTPSFYKAPRLSALGRKRCLLLITPASAEGHTA